jgi:hypothetical protein
MIIDKDTVIQGPVTMGLHRNSDTGQINSVWFRIKRDTGLNSEMQRRGIRFAKLGTPRDKLVWANIVGTFDTDAPDTKMWQVKEGGALYIEFPADTLDAGFVYMLDKREPGESNKAIATLTRLGAIHVTRN